MNDEAEDLIEDLLHQARMVALMTPQEKVDRMVRIAARGGLILSDEDKDQLLASYIAESSGGLH